MDKETKPYKQTSVPIYQNVRTSQCFEMFCNSASPEIIWGLGGPEEDHQLHHCCWTGRVSEREEEEEEECFEIQCQSYHLGPERWSTLFRASYFGVAVITWLLTYPLIQIRMIYFHSHIHTEKALNGM